MTDTARCIAVDWGTTSLRATLLGSGGQALDRVARPKGILAVTDGDFAGELDAACGAWRQEHPDIAVLMSGMIGAQQGWVEAPYLEAPCDLEALIAAMITVPGDGTVRIMPGVRARTADGAPEIMRGEETQIGGVITANGVTESLFCIPGTHSKWVRVRDGRIDDFATFMTGEVFAVLKDHSILGRLMEPEDTFDADTFIQGLERAREAGGLLHRLFSARTLGISNEMSKPGLASFLSGQLIGAEIMGARALYGGADTIQVLTTGAISEPYALAFNWANISTVTRDAEAAALAGLWAAAEHFSKS